MLLNVFITITGTMSLYAFTKFVECNFHPTTCKSISSDALYVILQSKICAGSHTFVQACILSTAGDALMDLNDLKLIFLKDFQM